MISSTPIRRPSTTRSRFYVDVGHNHFSCGSNSAAANKAEAARKIPSADAPIAGSGPDSPPALSFRPHQQER